MATAHHANRHLADRLDQFYQSGLYLQVGLELGKAPDLEAYSLKENDNVLQAEIGRFKASWPLRDPCCHLSRAPVERVRTVEMKPQEAHAGDKGDG